MRINISHSGEWGHAIFLLLHEDAPLTEASLSIFACCRYNRGNSSGSFIFPHFIPCDGNHYKIIRAECGLAGSTMRFEAHGNCGINGQIRRFFLTGNSILTNHLKRNNKNKITLFAKAPPSCHLTLLVGHNVVFTFIILKQRKPEPQPEIWGCEEGGGSH